MRERVPCELTEGDLAALRDIEWHFYWLRDDTGGHLIEFRPDERARSSRRSARTPAAQERLDEIRKDVRRRQIMRLVGIEVGAGRGGS